VTSTTQQGLLFDRPMRTMQFVIIAVCCLTNIADGVDIASLAFAAPVLIKDWDLRPAVLATLFGATATGLAIGAFFVAQLADRYGRQRVMLAATGTIAVAMVLTAVSMTVAQLAALRFITGICLGTLAVCLNVTVSEFANSKWRNISVAILHSGFSIGTMVGGTLAALLLAPYGWRSMFIAAGMLNAVAFVLILLLVPESPSFLVARGGAKTLDRLNRVMARLGQPPVEAIPVAVVARGKAKFDALLNSARRNSTLLLWLSQFAFALISYLLLNWKPTVLVNAGLTPTQAGWAGLASGFAGIIGHIVAGFLSRDGREARATMIFFFLLCLALLWFGLQPPVAWGLILAGAFTSFCNVGAFTGLLLIGLNYYPAAVRTASVSMLVGIARLGAITGPLFGGLLLELGLARSSMFAVLAAVALVPLVAMFFAMQGWRRISADVQAA
jgi:MFS family permease